MKSRQRTADVADLEAQPYGDKEAEPAKPGLTSVQKLALTIGTEYLFYLGAWVVSMWVLYQLSQVLSQSRQYRVELSHELQASWARLIDGGVLNLSTSPYSMDAGPLDVPVPLSPVDVDFHDADTAWASMGLSQGLASTAPPPPPLLAMNYHLYPAIPPTPPPVPSAMNYHLSADGGTAAAPPQLQPQFVLKAPPTDSQGPSRSAVQGLASPGSLGARPAIPERPLGGARSHAHRRDEPATPASAAPASEKATTGEESLCRAAKAEHNVVPGKSWGALSKKEIGEWMARRCDRFFCEPNKMEGRGVYACKPVGAGLVKSWHSNS